MYKYLTGLGPASLCEEVKLVTNARPLRSGTQNLIYRPRTILKSTERDLVIRGTYYWEMLDYHTRQAESVNIFKSRVKGSKVFNFNQFTNLKNCRYWNVDCLSPYNGRQGSMRSKHLTQTLHFLLVCHTWLEYPLKSPFCLANTSVTLYNTH